MRPGGLADDGGCANAAGLLQDLGRGERRALRGDVDGDERPDDAFIGIDEDAEIGCRGVLFVVAEDATYAAGVDTEATQLDLGQPGLRILAEIDGELGAEAIVDVQSGASTGFVAAYAIDEARLRQVRVRGGAGPPGGLFAYGGSVGHADGVDCSPSGEVVTFSAVPQGNHYLVRRFFLTPIKDALVANRTRTETDKVPPEDLFVRFPQLAGPPFDNCPQP